jgi:hypothetical protein
VYFVVLGVDERRIDSYNRFAVDLVLVESTAEHDLYIRRRRRAGRVGG